MGSAILVLQGTVTGLGQGQQLVNVPWSLPSAVGQWVYVNLAQGDNPINVPSGAATMLIIPPDNNAVSFTVKDHVGDVGCAAHPQVPFFRSLAQTVATVYLNAAAPTAGLTSIAFW